MKKSNGKVLSISFIIIIFSITILGFFNDKKTFSENENRFLSQLPTPSFESIVSGEFGKNYEEYLSDQFILRDNWISLKTYTELALGKKELNGVFLGKDNYLLEDHNDINETLSKKNVNRLNDFIKKYNDILGNGSTKALIVPTSSTTLTEKLPKYAETYDENLYLDYLSSVINKNNFIDIRETLNRHKDEYIYYKTDHHWTALGAYYSYIEWAKDKDLIPYFKDDFNIINVSNNFAGTLYSKINYSKELDSIYEFSLKNSPTYKVFYESSTASYDSLYNYEKLNTKDKYSFYLDGNHSLVHINTNLNPNDNLLVIKDSYAHTFVPFLANHYENIFMIDLRYYKSNLEEFIKENKISDILILYNAINFATDKNLIYLK